MRYSTIILGFSLVFLAGCANIASEPLRERAQAPGPVIDVESVPYTHVANFVDVTEGKNIRGITTGGNASGVASARVVAGAYEVKATFANLPDPQDDDFYEGWIVRKSPLSIVSTGPVIKVDGVYRNSYMSAQDMLDHTQYVLTIEPNDGDPKSADHILEADFVVQ